MAPLHGADAHRARNGKIAAASSAGSARYQVPTSKRSPDAASVARMEPTGPARSGRPDERLRAIRGLVRGDAAPDFASLHPGYLLRRYALRFLAATCALHRMMASLIPGDEGR